MAQIDLSYVKKKKARKVVSIVSAISAAGVLILAIVGLLSKSAGSFTVSLKQGTTTLGLSETEDCAETRTYLSVGKKVPSYHDYSYDLFDLDKTHEIDDPKSPKYVSGTNSNGQETISYFKYTFFIVNLGGTAADYNISLNMAQVGRTTTNAFGLESVLRVGFYENEDLSRHDFKVYALESSNNVEFDEHGNRIPQPEHISNPQTSGYAEPFISTKVVLSKDVINFQPGAKIRYTFLFWIEGEDPDCSEYPPDNTLKLSVQFNASEHVKTQEEIDAENNANQDDQGGEDNTPVGE